MATVTSRAGWARCASRPPLMRERCLRSVFISVIGAPQASSARVTACFSRSDEAGGGSDPVRRGAARDQRQHQIVGPSRISQRQGIEGCGESGVVGDRVPGLDQAHNAQRPRITMTCDGDPGDSIGRQRAVIEVVVFGRRRHGGRRLAGSEDDQPPRLRRRRQVRREAIGRVRGSHRRPEQVFQKVTGRGGHAIMRSVVRRLPMPARGNVACTIPAIATNEAGKPCQPSLCSRRGSHAY